MKSQNASTEPSVADIESEVREIPGEPEIVISAHYDDLRMNASQRLLDRAPFVRGRFRRVHQVAEKHDPLRPQFLDQFRELSCHAAFGKRPELYTPPQRPRVS